MRIFYLILFANLSYSALFSQEVVKTDSLKNSFGVSLETEQGFHTAFNLIGLDYYYRINQIVSVGGVVSFGIGDSKNRSRILYVMPYLRIDNFKYKNSPFIDIGVGYNLISWPKRTFYSSDIYDGRTISEDIFVATRVGFQFLNKKDYNISIFVKYQKLLKEGDFWSLGLIGYLRR